MPVVGSFLRTSTIPDLMMYIETPGAPSRTMTSAGGKSPIFKQLPSLIKLSLLSSANSLTFFKNPTSCSGWWVAAGDMNPYRSYLSNRPLRRASTRMRVLQSRFETRGSQRRITCLFEGPVSSREFGLHCPPFRLLRSVLETGRTWKDWYERGCRPDRFR